MLACLRTAALFGIDASPVHVEVDVSFGIPSFAMVGLPDASVRESRDRVKSAIRNSGFEFPPHRITVNLAPADVRKAGSAFDLPIALGCLARRGCRAPRRWIRWSSANPPHGAIQPARGASMLRRRGAPDKKLLPAPTPGRRHRGLRVMPVASLAGRCVRSTGDRDDRPSRGSACGAAAGLSRTWPMFAASRWRGVRSRSLAPAITIS